MRFILTFLVISLMVPAWAQDFQLHPERERTEVTQRVIEAVLDAYQSGSEKAVEMAVKKAEPKPEAVAASERTPSGGRKLTVRAYAYCLYGHTASGTYVKHGTVAVDPRVIKLGTKLYIPGYGWGKALDTGGAIKGNKIDLWMPNSSQCYNWGVRTVTITVFD